MISNTNFSPNYLKLLTNHNRDKMHWHNDKKISSTSFFLVISKENVHWFSLSCSLLKNWEKSINSTPPPPSPPNSLIVVAYLLPEKKSAHWYGRWGLYIWTSAKLFYFFFIITKCYTLQFWQSGPSKLLFLLLPSLFLPQLLNEAVVPFPLSFKLSS